MSSPSMSSRTLGGGGGGRNKSAKSFATRNDTVDPRTGLSQAYIPDEWNAFAPLRECITHWCSPCALLGGGSSRSRLSSTTNQPSSLSSLNDHAAHFFGGNPFRNARIHTHDPPVSGSALTHTASPLADEWMSNFCLIVSDSCVYVFDRSAVVIRCVPIAHIARLVLVDPVATTIEAAAATTNGGNGEGNAERFADSRRSNNNNTDDPSSSMCMMTIVGFEINKNVAPMEHDFIVGIPRRNSSSLVTRHEVLRSAADDGALFHVLIAVMLRLHFVHCGPNCEVLPVEVVPQQQEALQQLTSQRYLTVKNVQDGVPTQALAPCLGLHLEAHPQWTLQSEPLRTWRHLELLLQDKQRTLVQEALTIDAEFKRLKQLLVEHRTVEQQQQWAASQLMLQELNARVLELEHENAVAKELIEQSVPNGSVVFRTALRNSGGGSGGRGTADGRGLFSHVSRSNMEKSFKATLSRKQSSAGGPLRRSYVDVDDFSDGASSNAASGAGMVSTSANSLGFSMKSQLFNNNNNNNNTTQSMSSPSSCVRCNELMSLMESHPNVDKLRILKSEEALLGAQAKLDALAQQLAPLQRENRELSDTLRQIADLLRSAVEGSNSEHQQELTLANTTALRGAIQLADPFLRRPYNDPTTRALTSEGGTSLSIGDEVRAWRHLCVEQEERHQQELQNLEAAFVEYDEVMSEVIAKALQSYVPSAGVPLDRAVANIVQRAKLHVHERRGGSGGDAGSMASNRRSRYYPPTSQVVGGQEQRDNYEEEARHLPVTPQASYFAAPQPLATGWNTLDRFEAVSVSGSSNQRAGGGATGEGGLTPLFHNASSPSSQLIEGDGYTMGTGSGTPFSQRVRWTR